MNDAGSRYKDLDSDVVDSRQLKARHGNNDPRFPRLNLEKGSEIVSRFFTLSLSLLVGLPNYEHQSAFVVTDQGKELS